MRARPVSRRLAAWAAAAVVIATGTVMTSQGAGAAHRQTYVGVPYELAGTTGHVFYISGDATGLYPGATVNLPLTVTNPNSAAIQVNSLTVSLSATDHPACVPDATSLTTSDYAGPPFVVPGNNGQATVALPLTMPHGTGDACQDTTFTLTYGGTAVSVEGTPGTKTVTIGRYGQGNRSFHPGSRISIGVDVRLGSAAPYPVSIDVRNATVTMPIRCSNGSTPAGSPLTVAVPDQHVSIPLNSKRWSPATNGSVAAGYQVVVSAPNLCQGIGSGALRNAGRDVFTGTVDATDTPMFIKWHFAIPVGRGFADVDCSNPASNPDPGIRACRAGWSKRVDP